MKEALPQKIYLALFGSIVPLIGVLFFHWSVFAILLSYWLENVVIGVYQVLKMRQATMNYPVNERNALVLGPLRPVMPSERLFLPIFFCVHYGLFLWGHLQFLRFFGNVGSSSVLFNWTILLSALPFVITHGKIYIEKYIGEKQYEKIPLAKLFIGPYRRIVVLHMVVILGSIPLMFASKFIPFVGVFLILLKVILDVVLEEKEFAFWKKFDGVKV